MTMSMILSGFPITHYVERLASEFTSKEEIIRRTYKREKKFEDSNITWRFGHFHGSAFEFFKFCQPCTSSRRKLGGTYTEAGFKRRANSTFEPCLACQTRWVDEMEYPPATRMLVGAHCGGMLLGFAWLSAIQSLFVHWWDWEDGPGGFFSKFLYYSFETTDGTELVGSKPLVYFAYFLASILGVGQLLFFAKIFIAFQESKIIRYFWYLDRWTVGRYSIIETPIWERVYAILPNIVLVYLVFLFNISKLETCLLLGPLCWGLQLVGLEGFHLWVWDRERLRVERSELRGVRVIDGVDGEEKGVGEKPFGGLRED